MSVSDVQEPGTGVVVRDQELADLALNWLQTNVLRLIAVRVIPLIMASGVVTGGLAWLQDAVGIDLDPAVLTAYVVATMAGVVAVAFAYVKNHGGAAYIGAALLELAKVQEAGKAGPPVFNLTPGTGADLPTPRRV